MQEKNKSRLDFLKKIKKINISFGSDGDMDWTIIISFSFLIFLGITFWSFYVYFYVGSVNSIENTLKADPSELIDQKSLEEIIQRYQEKKKNFDLLLKQKPILTDPAR